jgi:hypothetical protein
MHRSTPRVYDHPDRVILSSFDGKRMAQPKGARMTETPLASWNEGKAKEAILTFVGRVTTDGQLRMR